MDIPILDSNSNYENGMGKQTIFNRPKWTIISKKAPKFHECGKSKSFKVPNKFKIAISLTLLIK